MTRSIAAPVAPHFRVIRVIRGSSLSSRLLTRAGEALGKGRETALARAYAGSMAPFRQIILESTSREECLVKLGRAYADWKPERLAAELETALQIAAAAGAAKAGS